MNERREQGFTLIELLVSLAILSIALAVLFAAISGSLDRARKDRDASQAALLVQSLLARAGNEQPLRAGDASGTYPNGYRWRLSVRPYGTNDDRQGWSMSAYVVRATVWEPTGEYSLTSLRLAAPEKPK